MAIAVSGVRSLGFQITGLPQTTASAAFQLHTATGKLNAVITAGRPERMPLLHQSVAGTLAGDREAVQLAAEPDGEVADVDHLLHLAERLALDLADLELHQSAEVGLVRAQQRRELADQLAAERSGCRAPGLERGDGLLDGLVDRRRVGDSAERCAGDRAPRRVCAGGCRGRVRRRHAARRRQVR